MGGYPNIVTTGVFESGISHHHPIFCFFEDVIPKSESLKSTGPKYDYCEANMLKFDKDITSLSNQYFQRTEKGFEEYVDRFKIIIDDNFKL